VESVNQRLSCAAYSTGKKACKLFGEISYAFMMGLLVFHLSFPLPLYAGDPNDPNQPPKDSEAPAGDLEYGAVAFGDSQAMRSDETADIRAARLADAGGRNLDNIMKLVAEAGKTGSRLARDAVFRNNTWLNQNLVDTKTGKKWDLSTEDLNRPNIKIPAGLVEWALNVKPAADNAGILLSVKGYKYAQEILFPAGVTLVDFDWDSERVDLLLSNGHRHQIEVSSLVPMLFQCNIPNFDLGLAQGVNGIIANKIRVAQRRVVSPDKSRAAVESNLNLNPNSQRHVVAIANGKLVQRLRENLELIKPMDLHPDWEKVAIEIGNREALALGEEPDGKVHHKAGNTLLIYDDGETELVIKEEERAVDAALVGLQLPAMMAMWTLASPESAQASAELGDMQASAQEAVAELLEDPQSVQDFYASQVYGTFAQMPAAGLNAVAKYSQRVVGKVAAAEKNGTPHVVQDQYTHEQGVQDYEAIKSFVDKADQAAKKVAARSLLNPLGYQPVRRLAFWTTEKLKNFDLAKRVRQATTVLKYGAAAATITAGIAGGDYMLSHGQNVALAIDAVAAVGSHVTDYLVPIAKTPQYFWDSILYSDSRRLAVFAAIMGLFALARPFSQRSFNGLITATGIKWLFAYTIIPPQRVAANLLFAPKALDAMKKGYAPWYLMVPGMSFVPSAVDAASKSIANQNRLKSLSAALAIHGVAADKGVSPLEIIQGLADPAKGAERVRELESVNRSMAFLLNHFGHANLGADLAKALQAEPEAFVQTWNEAKSVATKLAEKQPGLLLKSAAFLRTVATRKVLTSFGRYGDETFRKLLNPQPPEEYNNYVVRGWAVDGALTIFTSSKMGGYADPSQPDLLAYQPGVPVMATHRYLILNDAEQTVLHLGASAANDMLSAGNRSIPVMQEYGPAGLQDEDYTIADRGASRDMLRMAQLVFSPTNWRENNFFIAFGVRSFTQCVTLLQGFLVWGTVLRVFEPMLKGKGAASILEMDSWEQALIGQTYFIYYAPFMYRWFWAVVLSTTRVLDAEIDALAGDFRVKYTELQYALRNSQTAKAQKLAEELVSLYDERHIKVPTSVLTALRQTADNDVNAWAERVFKACRDFPPVPEGANESANKGLILVGGVVTTVLASYLMADSFADRPFWGKGNEDGATWGFDPNDLIVLDSYFNGTSAADSLPSLMAKSLANIGAVWGAGHALNLAVDTVKVARSKPGTTEAAQAAETLEASARAAMTLPGINLTVPKPTVNSTLAGNIKACPALLQQRAALFTAKPAAGAKPSAN
jgi:hypothetical protein